MTPDERRLTTALRTYARGVEVTDADLDRLEARLEERIHPPSPRVPRHRPWQLAVAACAVTALVLAATALWRTKGTVDEPVPAKPPTTRDATAGAPTGPVYLAAGRLHIGPEPVDLGRFTAQFTRLAGGVVTVEADTNAPRVAWRSWAGQTKVIGSNPWPAVEPFSIRRNEHGNPWPRGALRRDVVGNPLGDQVAWITQGSGRGDLVVVRASTGEEVARTVIPGGQVETVDIRSIDDRSVHLRRCPAPFPPGESSDGRPTLRAQSQEGCTFWVWQWPTGSGLRATGHSWVEPDGTVIHDMTTDVWAVQRPNSDALSFITSRGEHLADAEVAVPDRSQGGGLSPDGRFWYSPGSTAFVVTSTGEIRRISDELARIGPADASHFAWSGATTVTVAGPGGVTTCDASTATCSDPTSLPITDQGGRSVELDLQPPAQ